MVECRANQSSARDLNAASLNLAARAFWRKNARILVFIKYSLVVSREILKRALGRCWVDGESKEIFEGMFWGIVGAGLRRQPDTRAASPDRNGPGL